MKELPLLLAILAVATPAAAQQPTIRAGADQDGFVAAASTFLGRPADRGGLQLEAALHGDRWMQGPIVLHADVYKGRGKMRDFAAGPALVVDLREKDGKRVSAALSAGGGYAHGPLVLDARYTSGKGTFAVTAGVMFR